MTFSKGNLTVTLQGKKNIAYNLSYDSCPELGYGGTIDTDFVSWYNTTCG